MSDFPIQRGPATPAGAKKVLETDSRRGNEGLAQNTLSFCRGTEVQNDQNSSLVSPNLANGAASRDVGDITGLNAGSGRAANAKPVDARNIAGSYPGDTRRNPGDVAKSSLTQAAVGAGSPRSHVGQFPNGKNDAVNGSFGKDYGTKSFPGATTDSDAGN